MRQRGIENSIRQLRYELDAFKELQKFDPRSFQGKFFDSGEPNDYWKRLSSANPRQKIRVEFKHNSGRVQFVEMARFFKTTTTNDGGLDLTTEDVLASPFATQVIQGSHGFLSVERVASTTNSIWDITIESNDLFIAHTYVYMSVKLLFYGTDTGTLTITEI